MGPSIGITRDRLAQLHPRLYHMSTAGAWPSLQRHGLLSTAALLERFEVSEADRVRFASQRRANIVPIDHPHHGRAELRDHGPLSDAKLRTALRDGLTVADWYSLLNARVFFWPREDRLLALLGARAYRGARHTVVVVDTRDLLDRHWSKVELSAINSGSTAYDAAPRGRDCFLHPDRFAFEHWRAKRRSPRKAIAEVTVLGGVPDISAVAVDVFEIEHGERTSLR